MMKDDIDDDDGWQIMDDRLYMMLKAPVNDGMDGAKERRPGLVVESQDYARL